MKKVEINSRTVETIENTVSGLNARILQLQEDLTKKASDLKTLNDSLSSQNEQISALQTMVVKERTLVETLGRNLFGGLSSLRLVVITNSKSIATAESGHEDLNGKLSILSVKVAADISGEIIIYHSFFSNCCVKEKVEHHFKCYGEG